jgi:hypothetical protein
MKPTLIEKTHLSDNLYAEFTGKKIVITEEINGQVINIIALSQLSAIAYDKFVEKVCNEIKIRYLLDVLESSLETSEPCSKDDCPVHGKVNQEKLN